MSEGFPSHWEADVVLRDGYTCHIRPIRPADREALRAFHSQLSAETVYFRFFAPMPELSDRDLARFTTVDHVDRVALVATAGGQIIGVARYDRLAAHEAEVAFVVRDDHQGRGLGAVLLEHLASAAWERGVRRFVADVLPDNRRMLASFREAGYVVSQRMEDGVFHLTFDLEPTDAIISVRASREHRSEARSVQRLLNPSGVAVIGASRTPGRTGHELLRHLRDYGLRGPLFAVHPEADSILGVPTFRRITDIPTPVDVAVIAVPAADVLDIVDQCADAGVAGLVIVSSGFADTETETGRRRQRDLVIRARELGMRVVGPNCLGLINTDPRVSLNASLSPFVPTRGRTGLFCHSGALGVTLLEAVGRRGLGLSSFMSAGNRADISANDMLQYWESDTGTNLILLYLESIGNPRKFTRITRRLSATKPVVGVRSGRFSQSMPLGHRIRRTSLPPAAVDAVFEQSGILQTSSLAEMFDVGALLAYQPLPRGDRVAVVGTSAALEVLAIDALESARLTVSLGYASLAQSASAEEVREGLREATESPECDAVLFAHIPSVGADQSSVHNAVTEVSIQSTKPVIAVMPAADGTGLIPAGMGLLPVLDAAKHPARGSVPTFTNVEDAVRALALVRGYAQWRSVGQSEIPVYADIDNERANALMTQWLEAAEEAAAADDTDHDTRIVLDPNATPAPEVSEAVTLDHRQVRDLLACYGIRLWPSVEVDSEDAAVAAANELGYPVVLKTTAPWLAHRADLGGVRLNLESETAVRTAYLSMLAQLDERAGQALLVQTMAPPGVVCVAGGVDDPLFGPVVRFGVGGVTSELLGDQAFRIPPFGLVEARRLVGAPKAAPLLHGYRGAEPVSTEQLCDVLVRLGLLIDECPMVAGIDLNPIVVSPTGTAVLGAVARIRRQGDRVDVGVRRLLDA